MESKPKRRWLRFSVRTMLVTVMVFAFSIAWVQSRLAWIRDRHNFAIEWPFIITVFPGRAWYAAEEATYWRAPGLLWLFGERGHPTIEYWNPDDAKEAQSLFPEATCSLVSLEFE